MIRVTFDTNVLASGLLGLSRQTSTPGELLRRLRAGVFELATSEPLIAELQRTLAQPFFVGRVASSDAAAFFTLLQQSIVPLTREVHGVATHPEDDIVLATALSAEAQYIVTGDLRLLNHVSVYAEIPLISPRDFFDLLDHHP